QWDGLEVWTGTGREPPHYRNAASVVAFEPGPDRALAEVRRVLRDGGTLRFCEHVRADEPGLARWQDRLAGPWRWLARGCRANQDTIGLIRQAGFDVAKVECFQFQPAPALARLHTIGVAR